MSNIEQLFTEGDSYLKEAKSKFYMNKEEHCNASSSSCNSIKKYLDAYENYLFESINPSSNYHVLLHQISQKDASFKKFTEKIYEVKCFAEESKRKGEEFFLYADEINDVLKIVLEIRSYIASKIKLDNKFLDEYRGTSYMAT
jgi:hypothetical protein